jgi:hypothetical protein
LSGSGAGERLGLSACICSDDWHMKRLKRESKAGSVI